MHYCHTVALPGDIPADEKMLRAALELAMEPYNEDGDFPKGEYNGQWDWWVIGGRWSGSWVHKPGAEQPIADRGTAFEMGEMTGRPNRTDCARVCDIERESMSAPYSWTDLTMDWHSCLLGPEKAGTQDVSKWERDANEWSAEYFMFIQSLPPQTWLVNVDYHS